jgi:hypothetical protein
MKIDDDGEQAASATPPVRHLHSRDRAAAMNQQINLVHFLRTARWVFNFRPYKTQLEDQRRQDRTRQTTDSTVACSPNVRPLAKPSERSHHQG